MTWPKRGRRPLIPASYERAKLAIVLYAKIYAPEPVEELSILCLVRAWYGGYFCAAWHVFAYAIEHYYLNALVVLRLGWYRLLRLTPEQVDERFDR
jgi:hypothetical protein